MQMFRRCFLCEAAMSDSDEIYKHPETGEIVCEDCLIKNLTPKAGVED
ncbi:hypothetical protein KAR91_38605 [Candidatus Pacearchaeota archaeon]|nr:hypothetical protein [Candidatus Pacearchaeota archaeon]